MLKTLESTSNYFGHNCLETAYEDNNIIIVVKPPGILTHSAPGKHQRTLTTLVNNYLSDKGEPSEGFHASSCHRLDFNTAGLVIFAKNKESLGTMKKFFQNRQIKKYYRCLVKGIPKPHQAELCHFHLMDQLNNYARIFDNMVPGACEIITRYKVLNSRNMLSLLEIELVTGKTHQIRAHLAHIGHPILGDRKYGIPSFNRKWNVNFQALQSFKIIFDFENGGILDYLKGKEVVIPVKFKTKL